jgi:hypothetical protein
MDVGRNVLTGDDTVDDGHLVVDGDHVGVVVVAQALAGHQLQGLLLALARK